MRPGAGCRRTQFFTPGLLRNSIKGEVKGNSSPLTGGRGEIRLDFQPLSFTKDGLAFDPWCPARRAKRRGDPSQYFISMT